MALASVARRPASPNKPDVAAKTKVTTKSVVEVRQDFPETWLFNIEMTGADGEFLKKETLPHTITEWVGSAACVSPEDGFGMSDTSSIKGFQLFFISYTLPATAVRGEEFYVVVSVFSYADKALPVTVSLEEPQGYEVVNGSINGDICVKPGTSENLRIKLKATTVGKINITVSAATAKDASVCGGSEVASSLAKDAIRQSLVVEAEGFPVDTVQSILFCPTDSEKQTFEVSHKLDLPNDMVNDSARAYVDVTGNVMGPAIRNLDRLVTLPTGCGEQNLVKFTPNYLVLDYLSDIGKLTDTIKNKAIRNLNKGYQRQLTYRHQDGSFSAFGETDKTGSMFLTAFVLRSFHEAKRHIAIDANIIRAAQDWIVSKQQDNGCFPDIGHIISSGIQGGLGKEKSPTAITAYVLASLLIAQYENETVIDAAKNCLSEHAGSSPYETFLVAYAEALAGNKDAAKKRLADMKPFAITKDGAESYLNPNGTKAVNVETASYAILTNVKLGNGPTDALPLVRYLTQNMKPSGGFYSTQDTCVGLEALSHFAKLVYKDPVDIEVSVKGGLEQKVEISQDNKLLVQRNKVAEVPSVLDIEATGSGCGLIQTSLRYNTKTAPETNKFHIGVAVECASGDCKKKRIVGAVNYLPIGKKAGMSVVQVKMLTGIVPVKESLTELTSNSNNKVIRADYENNEVVLYFPEVSNAVESFKFEVEEVVEVENAQPATAKIFDYYAPENSATTSYSFEKSQPPTSTASTTEAS
ncbi:hypothetical protein JTE90_022776 [Oedothorax gibbosus]|uniref:Alpha-2-macroglobulin n=1 Tax=Oedothorax gibbosus TaxID=931172 RepID=A0AAV6U8X4_9ARAC|nr:hypothetical protein JTE90_022776 [Oedothorax gibbosus]